MKQHRTRLWGLALTALVLGGLVVSGCGTTGPPTIDKDFIDSGLFKHSQHIGENAAIRAKNGGKVLGCIDCHVVDREDNFNVLRPGLQEHAPCDKCHQEEYFKAPGDFCTICHVSVNPLALKASPMEPYPRRAVAAQLVSAFNHEVHLAGDRVKKDGKGLSCGSCHTVKGKDAAYATFPKHSNCAPCHAEVVSPVLSDCDGCHEASGPGKARHFIQNDIRFTHGKHQTDNAGQAIACETCHHDILRSSSSRDINLPQMKDCAKCHEDKSKTPDRVRISNCGLCHTTDVNSRALPGTHTASLEFEVDEVAGSWLSLAEVSSLELLERIQARAEKLGIDGYGPRRGAPMALPEADMMLADISGLVVTERKITRNEKPEDHSPLFRFSHSQAASSPNAKCGYCHTGLSGSPKDSCRDCHATWKPRDHTIRWRGVEHGRNAAFNSQRCATCHETDFCTECHNIPPPNHSPLNVFKYRHGRVARFNVRSCTTCHTFETTCIECHGLDVVPIETGSSALRRLQ